MKKLEETTVALKLLHTADWHLGRRFGRFDPEGERRLTRARLDVVGTYPGHGREPQRRWRSLCW